jgi:hypothetical protein
MALLVARKKLHKATTLNNNIICLISIPMFRLTSVIVQKLPAPASSWSTQTYLS